MGSGVVFEGEVTGSGFGFVIRLELPGGVGVQLCQPHNEKDAAWSAARGGIGLPWRIPKNRRIMAPGEVPGIARTISALRTCGSGKRPGTGGVGAPQACAVVIPAETTAGPA